MKLRLCSFESACVWEGLAWHEQPRGNVWSFKLCFDVPQRLGVFQVTSQQKKFEIYFQHTGVSECFPCIGQQFSLASQEFFPVSHMCLRRCQFSICGLKTTSIFSFSCASVIYVSKLKDKGYPPPVAFTGWATGGPEWCGLLFLDVRKSVTAESREKRDFYTTDGTLK